VRRRTFLTAAVAAVLAPRAGTAARRPAVAAHRGGALLWPENSLQAYREALALGVDLLETDVHLTADGAVVVLHDATLDRTTTGTGAVHARTLADLAGVRLRAADGTPTAEGVPTLPQLLDLVAPSRAGLLLEIKAGPGRRRYAGLEEKALALVRGRGLLERTVVMAFEPETVTTVRALEPAVATAALIARGRERRDRLTVDEALERVRAVRATHVGINFRLLDGGLVTALQQAGHAVGAWTVNEESDIRRVLDLGVDVLITDRPDLALQART
jgi:glycerophosphoryl diester phosphodiesterase